MTGWPGSCDGNDGVLESGGFCPEPSADERPRYEDTTTPTVPLRWRGEVHWIERQCRRRREVTTGATLASGRRLDVTCPECLGAMEEAR